jgi:hypothetical protein
VGGGQEAGRDLQATCEGPAVLLDRRCRMEVAYKNARLVLPTFPPTSTPGGQRTLLLWAATIEGATSGTSSEPARPCSPTATSLTPARSANRSTRCAPSIPFRLGVQPFGPNGGPPHCVVQAPRDDRDVPLRDGGYVEGQVDAEHNKCVCERHKMEQSEFVPTHRTDWPNKKPTSGTRTSKTDFNRPSDVCTFRQSNVHSMRRVQELPRRRVVATS